MTLKSPNETYLSGVVSAEKKNTWVHMKSTNGKGRKRASMRKRYQKTNLVKHGLGIEEIVPLDEGSGSPCGLEENSDTRAEQDGRRQKKSDGTNKTSMNAAGQNPAPGQIPS